MIIYLLKSATCLALLLAFYHLVLEREKMHNFNRIYLLSSILFSFLVPLYIIYIDVPPIVLQATETVPEIIATENYPTENIIEESINYTKIFLGFYVFVSFILLIRFVRNLINILNKIKKNTKIAYQNSTLVLVDDKILPHTFWNYIFINKNEYENQKIEQELFTHELTHVTQKHTLDILILEIIQVVCWINPFFILLKKAMKLNHEFLADETVINQHKNAIQYQHLLLNKAAWKNDYYLASNLNYSLTKKRLKMMTTQSSQSKILLKKLAVIPLLASFVFLFAERVEAQEIIEIAEEPTETIVEENSSLRKGLSNSEMDKYVLLIKKEGELIIQNQSTNINNLKKVIDAEINDIEDAHIILEAAPKANLNYELVNDIKNELRKSGIYKISFKNFTLSPKPHKVLLKKQTPLKGKLPNGKIVEVIEVIEETPEKKEYIDSPIQSNKSSKQSVNPIELKLKDINELYKQVNNPLDVYKRKNNYYEDDRKKEPHFIKSSAKRQLDLTDSFSELGSLYFELSKENKRKVKRPIHPHNPYIRLMKNNKVFYKLRKDLTEEEKLLIPPPPPNPNASETEILKAKNAYEAWKKRTGNDFAPKSQKKVKTKSYSIKVPKNYPTTGFKTINGKQHFYVKTYGKIKYYNREGKLINENGKVLSEIQVNATDIISGQYIPQVVNKEGEIIAEFKDNDPNFHENKKK
ncbi:M56 family metallopeptidase [Polaribacter sp. Asnod1-A03]|uniref:M56 family metallopeptidase n=1 Tax=Polaribacter sp. Asnod1-A03 TaxID=3160581 RepID=UPI0038688C7D